MINWERELAELRRRVDEHVYESERAVEQWRQRAEERLADADSALFDEPVGLTTVPRDAPEQFRDVVAKFESGELDWKTVMSGATEDEGGRAVSMWMDRRLQHLEDAGRFVRRGITMEEAYAETAGQVGP
ncbi:hypothetical protein AB0368_23995 [Actinoplanes sp. NPDC051475]|uniref:hypothetical protein n=1 Tax=Actinoplanes sp. NPDC051475 TaxID=3157225 RepID=UPI00345096C9